MRASADTIASRVAYVVALLDAEQALGVKGRFGYAKTCATTYSSMLVYAFRSWSKQQPAECRNDKGEIISHSRSPAATEAPIAQFIAALNHAANAEPPRSVKSQSTSPPPARCSGSDAPGSGSKNWHRCLSTRPSRVASVDRCTHS